MKLVRYAERPDLRARRHAELSGATFPEYMHHSESGNRYWGRLYSDFPAFQVALVEGDELLAEAHAVPMPWDGRRGSPFGLGGGLRARHDVDGCAHDAHGDRHQRGSRSAGTSAGTAAVGSGARDLQAQRTRAGLSSVVAPLRPTLKERYPLLPIERYLAWRRDDGAHFDPWIRIHEHVGGEIWRPRPSR
jgi:hypothetical protein